MSTNVATAPDPVEKRQSLQIINNFLLRLITHFKIETTKATVKIVPSCGSIIEGFPVISQDWVTVQVSHNCLSKTFVEFIEKKLNPVLISKGYSHLNAIILNGGDMSFCVEFAAKAITPHNLPIKGNEDLFDLFLKNWNEVHTKYFNPVSKKEYERKDAVELTARKKEVKALLKAGISKEVTKTLGTLDLKLLTGVHTTRFGANFVTTKSTRKDAVIADIEKVSETFQKMFSTSKDISVSLSYPKGDNKLPHSGYSIKIPLETLREFAKTNSITVPTVSVTVQAKSAPVVIVKDGHKVRKKRRKEMELLIPVVKEKVVPILKDSFGLLVHTFVASGLSVSVMVKFSKKSLDKSWAPGKQKVVSAIEEVFGVGCVEVNDSKKKEVLVGYSVLFPYEKAMKIFTGSVPSVVPAVQKIKPAKDELSEWASGIIVSALKQASEAQLLGEMYNRKHATAETIEKFISVCSSNSLIEELGKRAGDMKPEEKLKLIQLFSK